MKRHIPNILTVGRLILCVLMFGALVFIDPILRGLTPPFLDPLVLAWIAVLSFVIAAVTDFLDGWLARRWKVVSTTGAILDPIADKVLVAGAIVGLLSMPQPTIFVISSGLILFREFSVSALREVLAPKGLKLPVTFLAKTKTALQLIALAAIMIFNFWSAWGVEISGNALTICMAGAELLFAISAAITVWTGVEYGIAARKALKGATAEREPAPEPEPLKKPAPRRRTAKPE